jgi:hypothetical protein
MGAEFRGPGGRKHFYDIKANFERSGALQVIINLDVYDNHKLLIIIQHIGEHTLVLWHS